MEGCTGYVVLFQLRDMSDPSQSLLNGDGLNVVWFALGDKFTIGDGVRPEYVQYSSEVLWKA